jgi:hypothetical protein
VLALGPMIRAMIDNNEEAYILGREALAPVPVGHTFADSVLTNEMAYVLAVIGHDQESHKLLDAATARSGYSRSFFLNPGWINLLRRVRMTAITNWSWGRGTAFPMWHQTVQPRRCRAQ